MTNLRNEQLIEINGGIDLQKLIESQIFVVRITL